jgi:hypothetical protein
VIDHRAWSQPGGLDRREIAVDVAGGLHRLEIAFVPRGAITDSERGGGIPNR